jgi:hypothetical protein
MRLGLAFGHSALYLGGFSTAEALGIGIEPALKHSLFLILIFLFSISSKPTETLELDQISALDL